MADAKLTALTAAPAVAAEDVVYLVDVSDTTDDPAGSSRKATVSQLVAAGVEAAADPDAGVQLDVRAGVGMYTDDNGTVPATAGGQSLRRWKDQSPQGNDLKSPDRPPTVVSDGGFLVYSGGDRAMWAGPLATASAREQMTVHVLCRLGSATFGTVPLVSFDRLNPDGEVACSWNGQDQQFYLSSQNTTPTSGSNTPAGQATAYTLLSFVRDYKIIRMYQDGLLVNVFTATDARFLVNHIVLGGWSENPGAAGFWQGGTFTSRILEASVCFAAHSAAQVKAYEARCRTRYPTLYALRSPLVVFWGNSHVQGYLNWGTPSFVYKVGTGLALPHWYNRAGMTGSGTGVGTTQMLASVDQLLEVLEKAAPGAKKVLIPMEITNDIRVNGLTGAQAATNYLNLLTAGRDGGFDEVIAVTPPPCGDAGFNAKKDTAVANVVAGYASAGATRIARTDLNANIGVNGAENNATYFNGDKLHFTAAGHTEMDTAVVRPQVAAALA